MTDYYKTLKLKRNASPDEIRKAYRNLARTHHPDLNPGNKASEAQFKKINEAYEVLGKPESRKKYDSYGDNWKQADRIKYQRGSYGRTPFDLFSSGTTRSHGPKATNPFINFENIVRPRNSSFTEQSRQTRSKLRTETSVSISLAEAFTGTTVIATLKVKSNQRKFEVDIPKGVDTGSIVRISPDNKTDLRIKVTVETHHHFKRTGDDLELDAEVPFEDAILGGEITIKTISGKDMSLKILPLSQNGQRIKLKSQGMPNHVTPHEYGDLYVSIRPIIPNELNEEQTELIYKFKQLRKQPGTGKISSTFKATLDTETIPPSIIFHPLIKI